MHRRAAWRNARALLATFASAALAGSGVFAAAERPALRLPALHADPRATTVSGLSSGGFMAVQYATAYSASVTGVAAVAAGPYDCAVTVGGGVAACMTGRPSGALAFESARALAAAGAIDPLAGIARQRVYLFSGTRDATVLPRVVTATRDFYRAAGVPENAIAHVDDVPAGHAFLASAFGEACGSSKPPYVERCEVGGRAYDQPQAILTHLLGPLAPAAGRLSATLRPFDQREFAGPASSLGPIGYVYVPAVCDAVVTAAASRCRVHVVFHGCLQGVESVQDAVTTKLGFNRWADTNRVIVLYPQVMKRNALPGYDPEGCWDWWGSYGPWVYSGPAFATRRGIQPAAVRAMVERLTGS